MVNIGGERPDEAFWLSFGDVVAVSGDYFPPGGRSTDPSGRLFDLARVPGEGGTRLETRDEIVCALKVASVDEAVPDPRFQPVGRFGHLSFRPRADRSDVERAVRDRYLCLAAVNDDHFVAPGFSDVPTGSGFRSAGAAYRHLHQAALDEAWSLGRDGGDLSRAMAREAAAQHYLTDAFASGHLRTPVAEIRRYWKGRYPGFWEQLQRRVARDTADALAGAQLGHRAHFARLPPSPHAGRTEVQDRPVSTSLGRRPGRPVPARLGQRPRARNRGAGVIFGDGRIEEGVTLDLAFAAVQAGNDDVEVAFGLGRSGTGLRGEALYEAVRQQPVPTAPRSSPNPGIPRPSAANPPQNWHAANVETPWDSPIVGSTGTTVGDAIVAMLAPGEQFIRQLDSLGQGLSGSGGVFGLPVVGPWLSRKCCQAFHDGFVEPLAADPAPVLLSLVEDVSDSSPASL